MNGFSFTAPTVQEGYGYRDVAKSAAGGVHQQSFLNDIIKDINTAGTKMQDKAGKANFWGTLVQAAPWIISFLYPPAAPLMAKYKAGAALLGGAGKAYYQDKAMGDYLDTVEGQASRGYMSSQLPGMAEDIKSGKKSALQGNILSTLVSTLMAAKPSKVPGVGDIDPELTSLLGDYSMDELASMGLTPDKLAAKYNITPAQLTKLSQGATTIANPSISTSDHLGKSIHTQPSYAQLSNPHTSLMGKPTYGDQLLKA